MHGSELGHRDAEWVHVCCGLSNREILIAVDASWKAHVNKGRPAVVQGLKAFLDDKVSR
jgi:hypothetical protein